MADSDWDDETLLARARVVRKAFLRRSATAQQLHPKAAPTKRARSNGRRTARTQPDGAVGAKQRKVTASASGAAAVKPATFLRHGAERSSALAAAPRARANEKPIFNLEAELRRWPVSTSSRAQINFASDC